MRGVPVVAVSGVKNSGKTTLLTGLIPLLRERGLKLAVIKHDGHDFAPDVPGTDSFRLRQAGAEAVGVFSDCRYMLTVERPGASFETLVERIDGVDLILIEGAKNSLYPKMEIVREAVYPFSVCRSETLLALVTDTELAIEGVPVAGLFDYPEMAGLIIRYLKSGSAAG